MQEIIDIAILVTERLNKANIQYMISGSVAASFYAVPRMTNDIDIVIQVFEKDKETLFNVFSQDFYISRESIDDAFSGVGMFNIIHNKSVSKCDMILLKNDPFSLSAFSRAAQIEFEGHQLKLISLEDLILQKLLWRKESQSEQQLNDVIGLADAGRNSIDIRYLFKWADVLSVLPEIKKIYE
jgi:predicted nucleotidyltransferase